MSNIPSDLKYASTHEWCRVEGKVATIGVSDHAQGELGDVIYYEKAHDAGDEVAKGDVLGTLESVKATSDVYAPVGGKIVEVNPDLEDSPDIINTDPYGNGWIVRIEMSDPSELDSLMDAGKYRESIGE